jgi:hypothetical protein
MLPVTLLYTSPGLAEEHIEELRDEAARDRLARDARNHRHASGASRSWFGRRRSVGRPAPVRS